VDGLHVGLEAMLAGRDGAVTLAGDGLDGLGEGGVVLGLPGAYELGAVVGLPGGAGESDAAGLEVFEDPLGEDRGVGQAEFVGEAEEQQARRHVAGGVLVTGEPAALQADPVLGDVVEVLGVDVDLLKEPPAFFDLAEASLGLVLAPAVATCQVVVSEDAS
jgi:hypothetical protein